MELTLRRGVFEIAGLAGGGEPAFDNSGRRPRESAEADFCQLSVGPSSVQRLRLPLIRGGTVEMGND